MPYKRRGARLLGRRVGVGRDTISARLTGNRRTTNNDVDNCIAVATLATGHLGGAGASA